MIKLKFSDFFSFLKFRTFLLVMNLLFILDFYIFVVNQKHVYEINLKEFINFEFIGKIIILITFYFIAIQILYFLANLIKYFVRKNNDSKEDEISLNELKLYSIKNNNIVAFNIFLKKEKELEETYQEQVLAFGCVLFFIYSVITNFDFCLLIGIGKNKLFCYGILLLIFFCFYVSLFVPINRNYINDKKLKNIIKDEK